ncbi:MAG TPA: MlaD family protein [Verrucomicrobiota bacterium]|nr:hypothetical protein [Verrucomicrobiales bacterium]HRI15518.1 MlaD family protein [Verrucomicrobiota bacterium]
MALQDLTPQLRTRLRRVERLVGLFLLVTFGLMMAGFVYFLRHTAQSRGWFVTKIPYYTYIADATGLKVGTPVTMTGFKIGEITKVDQMEMSPWHLTNRYNVYVGFNVREPYDGYIWTDSKVKVGAGDLFGARTIEVTRGIAGEVTVKQLKGVPPRLLSDKFLYDSAITNRKYLSLEEATLSGGFWLKAEEAQPLQQRLSEISATINDALPGVFALTNQIAGAIARLTNITAQLSDTMPKVDGTVSDLHGILADFRPALKKSGGLGDLLLPTNLQSQLTLTLSNLNPGVGPIGLTLSNLNGRMGDVGVALSNVNLQLSANTNLLADANQLTLSVGALAETLETLFKRHWLFRSAFRTNPPPNSKSSERPINPPRDLRRF